MFSYTVRLRRRLGRYSSCIAKNYFAHTSKWRLTNEHPTNLLKTNTVYMQLFQITCRGSFVCGTGVEYQAAHPVLFSWVLRCV